MRNENGGLFRPPYIPQTVFQFNNGVSLRGQRERERERERDAGHRRERRIAFDRTTVTRTPCKNAFLCISPLLLLKVRNYVAGQRSPSGKLLPHRYCARQPRAASVLLTPACRQSGYSLGERTIETESSRCSPFDETVERGSVEARYREN